MRDQLVIIMHSLVQFLSVFIQLLLINARLAATSFSSYSLPDIKNDNLQGRQTTESSAWKVQCFLMSPWLGKRNKETTVGQEHDHLNWTEFSWHSQHHLPNILLKRNSTLLLCCLPIQCEFIQSQLTELSLVNSVIENSVIWQLGGTISNIARDVMLSKHG